MSWTLAGIDPKTKKPRINAIHIPDDLKREVLRKAIDEGWTGLVWSRQGKEAFSGLPEGDDTDGSASARP